MYRVSWVIDVEAGSVEAAAREALAIQRNPESMATIFEVKAEGEPGSVSVDLSQLDEGQECPGEEAAMASEGWAGGGENLGAGVTLVMEVVPCRGSEGDYPQWAEIQLDAQLLEQLGRLHAVCRADHGGERHLVHIVVLVEPPRLEEQAPLLAPKQRRTGPVVGQQVQHLRSLARRQVGRQEVGAVYRRVFGALPWHQAPFAVRKP